MTIEILIPVRNPTEVFSKTIDSLTAQTDKKFSVLISDNFSAKGAEHIESALQKLSSTGISARKIQPPSELGRVEHWNWIHQQSQADWLKPLFAGDWLDSVYMATVRKIIRDNFQCGFIDCTFQLHRGDEAVPAAILSWCGQFKLPQEMQEIVLRNAMQFGPPSSVVYKREVFSASEGYDSSLPICADALLYCTLAARHGIFKIAEPYVHFFVHGARFSDQLGNKRREIFREKMRYMRELGRRGRREHWKFPVLGHLRLFAREIYHYYKPW